MTCLCFLLAGVWLYASDHCRLEAAGIVTKTCVIIHCGSTDGCASREKETRAASAKDVSAKAPVLIASEVWLAADLVSWAAVMAPAPVVAAESERPLDWISSWQFARRMVLPSRAPSELFA